MARISRGEEKQPDTLSPADSRQLAWASDCTNGTREPSGCTELQEWFRLPIFSQIGLLLNIKRAFFIVVSK